MSVIASFAAIDSQNDKKDENNCSYNDASNSSRAERTIVVVIASRRNNRTVACKVAAIVITVLKVAVGVVPDIVVVSHNCNILLFLNFYTIT